MEDKQAKNMEKWKEEIKTLESLRRNFRKFKKAKEDKDKEEMNKLSDKVDEIMEENKWVKMDWKKIKRGKAALEEGTEKLGRKIDDRKKKIMALGEEAGADLYELGLKKAKKGEDSGRDWSKEISQCTEGSEYYHWAYGKVSVVAKDEEYLYVRIMDKKGCKHDWLNKGNVVLVIDENKEEEVKEFALDAIGRWLFPEIADVKVIDDSSAHRIFK